MWPINDLLRFGVASNTEKFISIISQHPRLRISQKKRLVCFSQPLNSAHRIGAHQKLQTKKNCTASCDISKCNCALHFLAPCIELPYKYSVLLRRLTRNELKHLFLSLHLSPSHSLLGPKAHSRSRSFQFLYSFVINVDIFAVAFFFYCAIYLFQIKKSLIFSLAMIKFSRS